MYTDEELAAHADTTVEQVRRMAELRIITPDPDGFGRSDIQLVRVADAMDAAGIGSTTSGSNRRFASSASSSKSRCSKWGCRSARRSTSWCRWPHP